MHWDVEKASDALAPLSMRMPPFPPCSFSHPSPSPPLPSDVCFPGSRASSPSTPPAARRRPRDATSGLPALRRPMHSRAPPGAPTSWSAQGGARPSPQPRHQRRSSRLRGGKSMGCTRPDTEALPHDVLQGDVSFSHFPPIWNPPERSVEEPSEMGVHYLFISPGLS